MNHRIFERTLRPVVFHGARPFECHVNPRQLDGNTSGEADLDVAGREIGSSRNALADVRRTRDVDNRLRLVGVERRFQSP